MTLLEHLATTNGAITAEGGVLTFPDGTTATVPSAIPMILHCPVCQTQHVDAPTGEWTNPPHRSHECQACHYIWRPADIETTGVQDIHTKGRVDGTGHSRSQIIAHLEQQFIIEHTPDSTSTRLQYLLTETHHQFIFCIANSAESLDASLFLSTQLFRALLKFKPLLLPNFQIIVRK